MNVLGAVFCGLVVAALIITVLYTLDLFGFKAIITYFSAALQKTNIIGLITQNWTTIAAVGVPMAALGITYFQYSIKAKQAQQQAEIAKTAAIAQMNAEADSANTKNATTTKIIDLEARLKEYEGDGTADALQKKLSEVQTQNQKLQNQVQELTNLKTLTPDQVQRMIEQAKLVK